MNFVGVPPEKCKKEPESEPSCSLCGRCSCEKCVKRNTCEIYLDKEKFPGTNPECYVKET